MQTTNDIDEARRWHSEDGGYLLVTGTPMPGSDGYHYTVCCEEEAIELGRSKDQLSALAPDYDESRRER